jgi:MATE family multidrug resistance protein
MPNGPPHARVALPDAEQPAECSRSRLSTEPLSWADLRAELRSMLAIAVPNTATAATRNAIDLTNTSVIGHLRNSSGGSTALYLDAASLAGLWLNVTFASFGRGCGGALAVLTSQAFGAGNIRLVGIWLLTGLCWFSLSATLLAGMWALTPWLLGAFIDDAEAVSLAGRFSQLTIPSVVPGMWMWALCAWLIAQRIAMPELIVYVLGVPLNVGLALGLVYGAGLGFDGAPLATVCTRSSLCAGLAAITCVLHRRGSIVLPRPTREALSARRMRTFSAQALPQLLMAILQEVGFSAVAFLASRLGEEGLAAHTAMMQVTLWLASPLFGFMTAAQVRIGNHLGAGNARAARAVALLLLLISLSASLLIAALLTLLRRDLGRLFTSDEAVVGLVADIAPIAGATYAAIGVFFAAMGTLNGQGRPLPTAIAFLCGAFTLSPSLGYVFAFVLNCCGSTQLRGIWIGFAVGYYVTIAIAGAAAIRSDWEALARAAQKRSEAASFRSCRSEATSVDASAVLASATAPPEVERGVGRDGDTMRAPLLPVQ